MGAASQGFEVTELSTTSARSFARFVDVSVLRDRKRAIHAGQFVYSLWKATKSDTLTIEYQSKNNENRMRTTVAGSDCEKVYDGTEEFSFLAKVAKSEIL